MDVVPALATLLRTWRERALLTQDQLADLTDLGVHTVRRLDADGLRRPRGDSLRLLADALNLGDDERALLLAFAWRAGPDPADSGIPRQLPADVAGFCGRGEHLRTRRRGEPPPPSGMPRYIGWCLDKEDPVRRDALRLAREGSAAPTPSRSG